MMYKSHVQKIDPCDFFFGPGPHTHTHIYIWYILIILLSKDKFVA